MGIQYQSGGLCRCVVAAALALTATAAAAADYPTKKAPPPAPAPVVMAPVTPGFFVKAGFLYAINQTSSKLYSQDLAPLLGSPPGLPTGPQLQLPGVGATIDNVATVGVEAGYFVTPNVSLDISAGVPMWANDKTKGTPTAGLPPTYGNPPSGTIAAKIMPSFVPVTALYHFNQFGAFQPYLGVGAAAVFSFQTRDEAYTGVKVDPNIGLVLQGGADYMLDQHWGVSFDAKKVFAEVTSHVTGLAAAQGVTIDGTQKTYFQPWVLSTGVTYRF
jgi:outer membrane protein